MSVSDTVDFLVSLLVCYPQINQAKIDSCAKFLRLTFLTKPGYSQDDFLELESRMYAGISLYSQISDREKLNVDLRWRTGFWEKDFDLSKIILDMPLMELDTGTIGMLIGLLEVCSLQPIISENITADSPLTNSGSRLNISPQKLLDPPASFYGFREDGKVLVFKSR